MPKNYSDSMVPEFHRQTLIDFDTDKFIPTKESIEVYRELNAISEEIERCRTKNMQKQS